MIKVRSLASAIAFENNEKIAKTEQITIRRRHVKTTNPDNTGTNVAAGTCKEQQRTAKKADLYWIYLSISIDIYVGPTNRAKPRDRQRPLLHHRGIDTCPNIY